MANNFLMEVDSQELTVHSLLPPHRLFQVYQDFIKNAKQF